MKTKPRGEIFNAIKPLATAVSTSDMVSNMISKEVVEEMVKKAAEEASKRTLDDTLKNIGKRFISGELGGQGSGAGGMVGGAGGAVGEGDVMETAFFRRMKAMGEAVSEFKKLATNPVQQAIEEQVGAVAADRIRGSFGGGPQEKKDIVDTVLNSQWAYGMGQGLGQRGPEMVDSLKKNYGDRSEKWIDSMVGIGGRGNGLGGQGGQGQLGGGGGPGNPGSWNEEVKKLDPNNPEHVSYYASKMEISDIGTARKMLMIHQDDIIKRMGQIGQQPGMGMGQHGIGQQSGGPGVGPGVGSVDTQLVMVISKLTDRVIGLEQVIYGLNNEMEQMKRSPRSTPRGPIRPGIHSREQPTETMETEVVNPDSQWADENEPSPQDDSRVNDSRVNDSRVNDSRVRPNISLVPEVQMQQMNIGGEMIEGQPHIEPQPVQSQPESDGFVKKGGVWKKAKGTDNVGEAAMREAMGFKEK